MRKCFVHSILVLIVYFVKVSELKSIAIEAECISNPTANPAKCVNHINEVMKRLRNYGPRLKMTSNKMTLRPGRGITRKSAVTLEDPIEQQDLIDKLQKSLFVNNEVSGDNVNFNQDLKLMKRIAVANNIKGREVNTVQNVKEFNSKRPNRIHRREMKKTRPESVKTALNKLSDALRAVASINDEQNDEEKLKDVAKALQRLAIKNNIKGNEVNTKQDIREYNEELLDAISEAARKLDDSGVSLENSMNDDLAKFAEELRRIAIKNDITGNSVNTKQNIKEYNDDVVKTIVNAFRRLAIKNDIKGSVVNTKQDVKEYNDDVTLAVAEAIRRLAIANNIKGNKVNTNQDVKEFNSDRTRGLNFFEDAASRIVDNDEDDEISFADSSDDSIDSRRSVQIYENPVNSEVNKVVNINTYNDNGNQELSAQDDFNDDNNIISPVNDFRRIFDETSADSEADEENQDDLDEEDENDELFEDEATDTSNRRMTVNNNLTEKKSDKRRLAIDNNIQGQTVNTDQTVVESNKDSKRKGNMIIHADKPASKFRPAKSTKPVKPAKLNKPVKLDMKITPSKPLKRITCKTKTGNSISDEDLTKFMDLLEKLKAAQRISVAMRSTE